MASVDDAETNKRFAAEHEADFPILSDPEKTVGTAYGVLGATGLANRWTFYIGGDGKIIYIEKGRGALQTSDAGASMIAKLNELADKGLIKRKK
jgi:peroxiredoxin Q/BCP